MARYVNNYSSSTLRRLLRSVQPIHVVWKLVGGVADVVRVPVAEYRRGGSVLSGLGGGVRRLTIEVCSISKKFYIISIQF